MVHHGVSLVAIGRSDYFGLNWVIDCHLKTALNMLGAMTYPFHKHVRLCELNFSKPRQHCISVKSYPYDLCTIPPLQVYCARPNGEHGVLEVLR